MHQQLAPRWLTHFGAVGLFSVAVVDSSVIPLPLPGSTDLLLLWLVAYSGDPWLLAPCAIAGSILGGYTTWDIGRRGGEAVLRHYVPAPLLSRVVRWVNCHRILAVFLPALLPPPIPLLPFALASGALGVSRRRFLAVFGAALLLQCLARCNLRAEYRPSVVWKSPKVVDTAVMRVRRSAGSHPVFWDMEDRPPAQGRCRKETCSACEGISGRHSNIWRCPTPRRQQRR